MANTFIMLIPSNSPQLEWEQLNNPNSKPIEFEGFRKQAGDGKEFFGYE